MCKRRDTPHPVGKRTIKCVVGGQGSISRFGRNMLGGDEAGKNRVRSLTDREAYSRASGFSLFLHSLAWTRKSCGRKMLTGCILSASQKNLEIRFVVRQ